MRIIYRRGVGALLEGGREGCEVFVLRLCSWMGGKVPEFSIRVLKGVAALIRLSLAVHTVAFSERHSTQTRYSRVADHVCGQGWIGDKEVCKEELHNFCFWKGLPGKYLGAVLSVWYGAKERISSKE